MVSIGIDGKIRSLSPIIERCGMSKVLVSPKARSWWQQSARLGNAQASWRLAQLCRQKNDGLLVAACIDSVEQAAKGNVIEAQRALAQWYSQKKVRGI